ncbi:CNNM domain-containing protein [Moraxella sp. FZLJ2107]|nr:MULTISPECIES: CNNM domain-containing protein [unclassified Moraxella]USZ15930.1 CNNM domain-containing protein [Moraxella sp. FZFQ2102]UTO06134.1 CNNM domain-containing protein [Moraxella sp. FZLJ2107]UTO23521.1 CNNM domain-containing protein [Moraxella sp. FZLJ2109]
MPMAAHASFELGGTPINLILLIFFISLSLIVSFVCSVSEAVLLTMTPSYIDTLQEDRPKIAALLKEVKIDNIEKSISAILTLNTVAHTLGSLGAGAQAVIVFGDVWFGVFSGVLTLVILIGTEIIPKTLGTTYWRRFATPVAYYVRAINWLLMPIIWITEKISRFLTKGHQESGFNRHEFLALATQGESSGQMSALETRIIKNSLALGVINVEDIVSPRSVVMAFDENMTVGEVLALHPKLPFSRFPIYDEDLDNATGFVLKSDLLIAKANQGIHTPIKQFKRDINFVFAKMKLFDLLDLMLKERVHIALAVGEFGEVKGLVSLEDVLETLLGLEIVDEFDRVDDMQALAHQLMDRRMARLGAKLEQDDSEQEISEDKSS